MLALCYPVLVSLALAAPGISRSCYDYCNTKESDKIKDVVPRGCDCAVFTDTIEEVSMITLEDTGVYFIPAESHASHGQFSSQPFFISNPGKLIPKTKSRNNREFGISQDALSDPMHSQSAHVEIYEKTETISHTSIKEDLWESPLYLDLEIQEPADNRRAAVQKYALIEDIESTEHALVECLDFQVIHYTRKYGFMSKFKEFWVARKLSKYEHWSDLEIEANIKKWCSEPESIVQQSLRDIKQGLPKKVPQRSAYVSEDNASVMKRASNATIEAEFSGAENSTSMYDNDTAPSETHGKIAEEYTSVENATEIQHTTYDPIDDWPFSSVTSSLILNQDILYGMQNSSPPTASAIADTTAIITENTLTTDNPKPKIFEVKRSNGITSRDAEHDLDTLGSENVNTYVPNQTKSTILDDVSISDSNETSLHILTASLSTEDSRETTNSANSSTTSATTNFNISNAQTLDEFTTLWYDTSSVSVTEVYPELRNKYKENDIKIPKVVTKECRDKTIFTTIEGYEELPNNDFKGISDGTEKVSGDNELDITGRFYFVSKNELVPVRFLQTKGGNISLGIDGFTLCDKLVRKTSTKSRLLTTLCDHVENNIDQDK